MAEFKNRIRKLERGMFISDAVPAFIEIIGLEGRTLKQQIAADRAIADGTQIISIFEVDGRIQKEE